MKLYPNTERELTMFDYKALPVPLAKLTLPELRSLYDNVNKASENAWINHAELLALALDMDLRKLELYITMKERKQEREKGK